jgi:hypothetical protein
VPDVRDDRERPSLERDGGDKQLIWVRRERLYFCKWDWTAKLLICPSGQISEREDGIDAFAGRIAKTKSRLHTDGMNRHQHI